MVERPDAKPGFAIDPVTADRSEEARGLRAVAVVAHHEVAVRRDRLFDAVVPRVVVRPLLRKVRLLEPLARGVALSPPRPQALPPPPPDPLHARTPALARCA